MMNKKSMTRLSIIFGILVLGVLAVMMMRETSSASNTPPVVHISHWDYNIISFHLRYCNNTGGTWSCADAGDTELDHSSNFYTSIALDSNNKSHISHSNATYLDYCNNTGGTWSCANISSGGTFSSLAIDSNNIVHISHIATTNNLVYCNNTGGTWSCVTVDTNEGAGSSLALDSNNKVHISNFNGTDLRYCNNTAGTWSCVSVIIGNYSSPYAGSSIAIDSNDKAHISYINASALAYCNNAGGTWSCANNIDVGNADPSLALDSNNKAHISHWNGTDFKYCNNTAADGSWSCVIIDASAPNSFSTSLAIDSNNKVHISHWDGTDGLKYCNNTAADGSWSCAIVDNEPGNNRGRENSLFIQGMRSRSNVIFGAGSDSIYPIFSNYWDNNATLINSGMGLFNVTLLNTNGTVLLDINNTNYTATNLTGGGYIFNASHYFNVSGIYPYRWHSWGNGSSHNYNVSNTRYYSVNGDTTPPNFTNIRANQSYALVKQYINFSSQVADNILTDSIWLSSNFDIANKENQSQTGETTQVAFGNKTYRGQTFQPTTSGYAYGFCVRIYNTTKNRSPVTFSLYAAPKDVPGKYLTNYTSTSAEIPSTLAGSMFCRNFSQPAYLTGNARYALIISARNSSLKTTSFNFRLNGKNNYKNGLALTSTNNGTTWTKTTTSDFNFTILIGKYDWKNETKISINSITGNTSQVKKLFWANNISFNYRWCANDSSGNQNCSATQNYYVYFNNPDLNDSIFPLGGIYSPPNSTKVNGNLTIFGWASDNIGINYASMQYKNTSMADWANFSGCERIIAGYNCLWNTHLFSNDSSGYDIRIMPCDLAGNCNTTTIVKHYTIDRNAPYYNQYLVIYPALQSSIRNNQNLSFKINLSDGSGAGMNITGILVDLSLLNGTGKNKTMTLESGSVSSRSWSFWNITSRIIASSGEDWPYFYAYDNATPTNNLMWNSFSRQVDNINPDYDNSTLGNSPSGVVYNNTNVSFQLQATDNLNLSYFIFSDNFSGSWINTSINFTQALDDWAAIEKNVTRGNWSFFFIIYDDAGNFNQTEQRTIAVLGEEMPILSVNLTNPQDETIFHQSNVTFTYNYTNGTASTCSLFVNDALNSTTINPVENASLSFQQNFSDNTYSWFVRCNNTDGMDYDSEIMFFTIAAETPAISLISPDNSYSIPICTSTTPIAFSYNVSDTNDISNCSLIINNVEMQNQSSITKDTTNTFTETLSKAAYTWQINCTNSLNNQGNSSSRVMTVITSSNCGSTPPGTCTDTCSSLGYECGTQIVCGASKICGNCALGKICKNGKCTSNCTENWECTSWSECENNTKTRTCRDLSSCSTQVFKPETTASCLLKSPEENCTLSECSSGYNLKTLIDEKIPLSGIQYEKCMNSSGSINIEQLGCNLGISVIIKKVIWCNESYVEVYERDSGKLVSRLKQYNIENISRLNVNFIVSNFSGYCEHCYNGRKDSGEENVDCGGSCSDCLEYALRFDWIKWLLWFLWILFIVLIIIYIIENRKEEDRKIKEFLKQIEVLEKNLKKPFCFFNGKLVKIYFFRKKRKYRFRFF